MTEEELECWKKTQNRHCMYFDGASKNNPGKAGVGRIIYDPNGKKITTYEWGLGQISNNQAEAYRLLMGTRLIKKKGIQNPTIIGDLAMIIEIMARNRDPNNKFMS